MNPFSSKDNILLSDAAAANSVIPLDEAISFLKSATNPHLISAEMKEDLLASLMMHGDYFLEKLYREEVALEDNPLFETDPALADYKSAAAVLLSTTDFTPGYKDNLYNHLANKIPQREASHNWNRLTLDEKIERCNALSRSFMDSYDPERLISLPNDTYVDTKTEPLQETKGTTVASYNWQTGILFSKQLIGFDKEKKFCQNMTDLLLDKSKSNGLVWDQEGSLDDKHIQTNFQEIYQAITYVGNYPTTKNILAHELCHLVTGRLKDSYLRRDPQKLEDAFNFTKHDYAVAKLSRICYAKGHEDYSAYQNNKEETLAFGSEKAIKDRVLETTHSSSTSCYELYTENYLEMVSDQSKQPKTLHWHQVSSKIKL